jgi:signal peptidase I
MTLTQWLIFFLAVQLVHGLGTFKLYQKAGHEGYKAFIPVYNLIAALSFLERPKWWTILFFLPIINLILFPVLWIDLLYAFKKKPKSIEMLWVILSLGLYLVPLNYASSTEFQTNRQKPEQTKTGEWLSSLTFAVVAATLVHTYFLQPYAIPTGSLERTLRIGDFLIVSKFHYGARIPMTAVSTPMVHDTLPILKVKSYLKKPQIPYLRLPGIEKVKKNDIVVFNWPADTVRQFFVKEKGVKKPIDKKSNYVKRCVGTPGDTLEIIDGFVYINGVQLELDERARPMYNHKVYSSNGVSPNLLIQADADDFSRKFIVENLTQDQYNALVPHLIGVNQTAEGNIELYTMSHGIPIAVLRENRIALKEPLSTEITANLTLAGAELLAQHPSIDSISMDLTPKGVSGYNIFPQNDKYTWNEDQFGPIYLPKEGDEIELNLTTYPIYKKLLTEYEGNSIELVDGKFILNGSPSDRVSITKNYYWMMGDNRDHSEDSRSWGFVPEDHILGKPIFIWMSWDHFNDGLLKMKPRWDRFFTTVKGPGQPQSYLWVFVLGLVGYFGFKAVRKRKKA